MEFLKVLFESGAITWDQFSQAVTEKGYKLADLSAGTYVDKRKYETDLAAKDATISELNSQISTRDTDLANLQTQLANAGTDNKTKVAELTSQITELQGKYDNVRTEYEGRLATQAYEFAVKEFANTKQFTSNAAKRDFINEMIKKELKMEGDKLLGAEDFVKTYSEANADAFVVEDNNPPAPQNPPSPNFVNPPSNPTPPNDNAFLDAFNFTGVRPKE